MSPEILKNPIEQIHNSLLKQQYKAYVLIDVNSEPTLRGELFNQNDNPVFRCLFHGTILQELRDRAPYLIEIELNQYQYIQYLLKQAPDHFMLFFSNQAIDRIYQHWQSLLTVYGLDGEVALYKLYTPQVLGPYLRACKPLEQDRLLAGINELYLNNELDQWEAYYYKSNHQPTTTPCEPYTCHPELKTAWWHLKEHHLTFLTHLTEASLLSNMEEHMFEHNLDLLMPYKTRNISRMIHHGIRRARHYGISTRRDFAFYIGMMFEVAPNFDEHPVVQQWLYQWDEKVDVSDMADELANSIWIEAKSQYDDNAWYKMQNDYQYHQPHLNNCEVG